jgi:hypothetical protein
MSRFFTIIERVLFLELTREEPQLSTNSQVRKNIFAEKLTIFCEYIMLLKLHYMECFFCFKIGWFLIKYFKGVANPSLLPNNLARQ